ncbi:hypothetical protein BJ742DRAFT_758643, partial [Cladochytrium replicatum]
MLSSSSTDGRPSVCLFLLSLCPAFGTGVRRTSKTRSSWRAHAEESNGTSRLANRSSRQGGVQSTGDREGVDFFVIIYWDAYCPYKVQ